MTWAVHVQGAVMATEDHIPSCISDGCMAFTMTDGRRAVVPLSSVYYAVEEEGGPAMIDEAAQQLSVIVDRTLDRLIGKGGPDGEIRYSDKAVE